MSIDKTKKIKVGDIVRFDTTAFKRPRTYKVISLKVTADDVTATISDNESASLLEADISQLTKID